MNAMTVLMVFVVPGLILTALIAVTWRLVIARRDVRRAQEAVRVAQENARAIVEAKIAEVHADPNAPRNSLCVITGMGWRNATKRTEVIE